MWLARHPKSVVGVELQEIIRLHTMKIGINGVIGW